MMFDTKAKRFIAVFTAVLILTASIFIPAAMASEIVVWDGMIATSFSKGTGAKDDPYLIGNGAELAYAVNNSAALAVYSLVKTTIS